MNAGYNSLFAFWVGGASVIIPSASGGQWYDIKYESEWVKNSGNEWLKQIVQEEDWLMDFVLSEDDF